MRTVIAQKRQSWFDIAIQYTGNVFNAHLIAWSNDCSPSDDLLNGQSILIPEGLTLLPKTMQYLDARTIRPATGGALLYVNEEPQDYVLPGEFPISF